MPNLAPRARISYAQNVTDNRRVVVVGSGPAGATAALMLLERGIPVTLLESGGAYPPGLVVRAFGYNVFRKWAPRDERYDYVATDDPQTYGHSALVPGGLSNYWTGAVPRFAPDDFFEGARMHERYRWPLLYADVEPYYTYAERLLGVVGEHRAIPQVSPNGVLVDERQLPRAWQPIATAAEAQHQGLMYSPLADGPRWLLRRSGAAFNSFERIVSRLGRFPGFELRLGAHAQSLTWDPSTRRVSGVEYVDRASGSAEHVPAAAVVVGAGPLASPKLLLQSVSNDFPHGLGNTHGVLGHYLHDHPHDWCILEVDRPLPRLDQPLYVGRAPYADSPPLSAASMTLGPLSKWDRFLSAVGSTTRRFGVVTFGTMLPEMRNYVALDSTQRDQFGMPVLDIHISFGQEVPRTVDETHARLISLFERAGIRARLECPVERLLPGSAAHYGGAVRMHASPDYGVLNAWNRLHDADNVAVVDASSFTTGVEKNPTLTIMALAARAADRLAGDLKTDAVRGASGARPAPARSTSSATAPTG